MNIVVCIHKPKGISSQDAVTKVKRILKVKKAGHTGTLDPLATGMLIVCINRATRLASYFTDLHKAYTAVMKLGESTDTQDSSGAITETCAIPDMDRAFIKNVMETFRGKILQQPPMYSALKHKGTSLYKYARQGIEIERPQREVTVHSIEIVNIDVPFLTFKVVCSKGTYIRTLCHDMGKKLGTAAHMHELERTGIGAFSVEKSLTFEELRSVSEGDQITHGIYTMDEALSWLPEYVVNESTFQAILNGNPVKLNSLKPADDIVTASGIRIKSSDGTLLAIGSYVKIKNMIKMDVVFT